MSFFRRADPNQVPLSANLSNKLCVGQNDGELYWNGKKIKRGNFTLSDTIIVGFFTGLIGLFTGSVLFLGNLTNIKKNVCDNIGIGCSTPGNSSPSTDSDVPDAVPGSGTASPKETLPGK